MSAFGNFKPPFSMYGGQIGPWVNKKKKKWLFVNLWSLMINFKDFFVYL
jgi:hypothetical protein